MSEGAQIPSPVAAFNFLPGYTLHRSASFPSPSTKTISEEEKSHGARDSEHRQDADSSRIGTEIRSSNGWELIQSKLAASTNHGLGKTLSSTNARLYCGGKICKICIQCDTRTTQGWEMVIRVGSREAVRVKHLVWNFRGNERFYVDCRPDNRVYFDVLWDVYDWLYRYRHGQTSTFLFNKVTSATSSPPGASDHFNPSYSPNSHIHVHAWERRR